MTIVSQGLQIPISQRYHEPGINRYFYITNEFLKPNAANQYYIEGAKPSVIATTDDLLMTRTGNTGMLVTGVEGVFHNNFFKIDFDRKRYSKYYLYYLLRSDKLQREIMSRAGSSTIPDLNHQSFYSIEIQSPISLTEQTKIGQFFKTLDDTIALHQSKSYFKKRVTNNHSFKHNNREHQFNQNQRGNKMDNATLLVNYYEKWIELYKVGAVKDITLKKYYITLKKLKEIAPKLKIQDLNRGEYQNIINIYALTHERQTTMDFHHQLKGAILDAVDDGLIKTNPLRKIVIKGKLPSDKKPKFLSQYELQSLIKQLHLTEDLNWDWFILLVAKTGLRFSEALALTPSDFDLVNLQISISKSWNYKLENGAFQETKNNSSVRRVRIDWKIAMQFSHLLKELDDSKPIFVKGRVFNSTVNSRLSRLCKQASIPIISIHGLRHTHASLLLYANVSIASVAKRLGHSSMTTTQETYLHIIQELESQDNDKIMMHLSSIF